MNKGSCLRKSEKEKNRELSPNELYYRIAAGKRLGCLRTVSLRDVQIFVLHLAGPKLASWTATRLSSHRRLLFKVVNALEAFKCLFRTHLDVWLVVARLLEEVRK